MFSPYFHLEVTCRGEPLQVTVREEVIDFSTIDFAEKVSEPVEESTAVYPIPITGLHSLHGYIDSPLPTGLEVGAHFSLESTELTGVFQLISPEGAFRSRGAYTLQPRLEEAHVN